MQYGYFDDDRREYVITRPDTPKSWGNYLGSTEYGAIITNNAGGYSFWKSGGMGRFMRFRFNSIPADQPGRYIYLRDQETGDYWSTSWQPVGKPLSRFLSVCRHGTGYTTISSEYDHIASEVTYFVPLGSLFEVWKVQLTNRDKRARRLAAFTYVEYAGNWNAIDDLLNIQYVQYTSLMKVVDGIIDHGTNVNIPEKLDDFKEKDQGRHTFQAVAGAEVIGYETDREAFLGPYRTYANPLVVERGACCNSLGYGDNPSGSLQLELSFQPDEKQTFLVLVGVGRADREGIHARSEYLDPAHADQQLANVKRYWHDRLDGFASQTPDPELDSTVNTWGIYNSLITFAWSRSASLIYSGIDRDGLGYRDTVQDFLGVVHAIPDEVRTRLELMLTGQVSSGGAMPCVLPFSHRPGTEEAPKETQYRSDDALWLFNAVPAYVNETGDLAFYQKVLPYADRGAGTVLAHLRQAIQFNLERTGSHGLPCGLRADWNDCLRFGAKGESVFVAMQLRLALDVYAQAARLLNESEEETWAIEHRDELDRRIQESAWDGEWFVRGFREDGFKFGSRECAEGKIFLNPQSWAVISGAATAVQAATAMNSVSKYLATEYGLMLCDPPYTQTDYKIVRAQLMNPSLKENGSVFVHTQGWAVIAECLLGRGNQACRYLRAYLPAAYNTRAEVREVEPYVVCQSTHAKHSPKPGASRIPWLSGSAAWTYYAITQYVLGVRPELDGLRIDPCIPDSWPGFSLERRFRGKRLRVWVENPDGVEKGVRQVELNGEILKSNLVPAQQMMTENQVVVRMG
jgi:N,N'-diacetylchitobiose phosphorylase